MKFSSGCCLRKEDYSYFSPQEVYFTKIEDNKVTLCAPTTRIITRGDAVRSINLTVVITTPAKDVIRVQTYYNTDISLKKPQFELNITNSYMKVTETDELITVTSGNLSLEITKFPWSMTYKHNGSVLSKSGLKDLALMKTNCKGYAYDNDGNTDTYIRQQLSIGVGELLYGFGEHFTPLVKNGQSIDIFNQYGDTSTEQSCKNIPFYMSNKGYGVFVNHPDKVSFKIGTEVAEKAGFSVAGGYLDYFFIDGPSMKDVLIKYTDLTGKPSLPAPWTFGLWLSTSFTTNYDENTVMSFIDDFLDRGIPLRVFHFDCFWTKNFHWSNFLRDRRVSADTERLLKKIKAKGLNICVCINSYIEQESILFAESVDNGYFVRKTNGDIWQCDTQQSKMALVDFTNPDAYKWFQLKLEILLDIGVDCFKTDFDECIPTEDVMYFDGSDPEKMHNYYTYLYNKCVYELLERARGKGEAVLFARSATVGSQKFPVHWSGDCPADYESMKKSLRGGLSLCMSGFGYSSQDIGRFDSISTPDVYKRWATFGILNSHSRLHESFPCHIPFAYDEETIDIVRTFTLLKASLMPYLYRNAIYTAYTGIPMIRSMALEFSDNHNCSHLDGQYMMGPSFLVAPIFNENGIAEYYLPAGTWTNYFTGRKYNGGCWYSGKYSYLEIPLFVRENSIIAVNPDADRPDYDYADNVTFRVYEPSDCSTTVYDMNVNIDTTINVRKAGNELAISITGTKKCNVELINMSTDANLTGLEAGTYTVTVK